MKPYLLLVSIALLSCQSSPQPKPESENVVYGPWKPVVEFYQKHDSGCPSDEIISIALKQCVDLETSEKICRVDLKKCGDVAFLDKSALQTDVDSLKSQRWLWGIGGVAIGVLAAGLLVGLCR